jgi:hypothetical protein
MQSRNNKTSLKIHRGFFEIDSAHAKRPGKFDETDLSPRLHTDTIADGVWYNIDLDFWIS